VGEREKAELQVPTPNQRCAASKHTEGYPRCRGSQVRELENPEYVWEQVMRMLVRMAEYGLVHCDLNEFNLMVRELQGCTAMKKLRIVRLGLSTW
jgi:RIO kinase 2